MFIVKECRYVCGRRKGSDVFFCQKTPKCTLGGGAVSLISPSLSLCLSRCARHFSGHAASLVTTPLSLYLFSHHVSLVALVTSLVVPPIPSCRLSHCIASPIALDGCCILASLVVPLPLLLRLLSHCVSLVIPPPLLSHLPSSLMPLPMPDTSPTLPTMQASHVHLCVCQHACFIAHRPFIGAHHVCLILVIYALPHRE